jgi:PKHD-type hydroxylase
MIITEPVWKNLIAYTISPIFTSKQCQDIIKIGSSLKTEEAKIGQEKGRQDNKVRTSKIGWIPFNKLPEMYSIIEKTMLQTNGNHFGFEGMRITELAQYTEYPKGGFYNWHTDSDISGIKETPVRKISMTCLLSDPNEFVGGELEFIEENKKSISLKQGQAIFFASFIRHRVSPIKKGVRKSLVMWFGGPPFK